jgi:hypothetical protein
VSSRTVEVYDYPAHSPGAMTDRERHDFRAALSGSVTEDGFLVLTAAPPLALAEAGEHAGPALEFGSAKQGSPGARRVRPERREHQPGLRELVPLGIDRRARPRRPPLPRGTRRGHRAALDVGFPTPAPSAGMAARRPRPQGVNERRPRRQHPMQRKLAAAVAAIALSATTADAATTTLRLHTQADTTRFMSDSSSAIVTMAKNDTSDARQKWRRTDTTSGYATYRNVGTGRCLTWRGIQGFPVVSAEMCVAGALNQQWRLGVSGDLQLRLNGLVAKHNTAGNGIGVVMSLFQAASNQKWHTHPA